MIGQNLWHSLKQKIVRTLLVTITTSLFLVPGSIALPAQADVIPQTLGYQGRLKNSGGTALTGNYSFTFRLYTSSTGGVAVWNETQPSVSVDQGSFAVQLGSVNPLTTFVDFTKPLYLTSEVH